MRSTGNGGYSVTFSGYPTLQASSLSLDALLPPPMPVYEPSSYNTIIEEVIE